MRIGIGLPAATPGAAGAPGAPGAPGRAVGEWAASAEASGFESIGDIDRLVHDEVDPLVALAVAAARTERVELLATVLTVPWRRNTVRDETVAMVRRAGSGDLGHGTATIPDLPSGRPRLLFGGVGPAGSRRAAGLGDGWVRS
jgi:alkanesulfonate monooxygenase SsuD/methylene tetrahydromethanopterin reductase-like flavin-dependent oxidoreductase (luciferase family)